MSFADFHRLLPAQYLSYAIGRGTVILALIGILIGVKLRVKPSVLIAAGWLSYVLYVAHGQFYRPGYYLGYFEGVIALTFLFETSARLIQVLLGTGIVVFSAALYLSPVSFFPAEHFRQDVLIGTFIVNTLGLLTHRYIVSQRHARQELFQRFAELGKHSAMMMHDLKGLMSSPILSAQLLEKMLDKHPDPRVQKLMTKLGGDLERLRAFALDRNRMVAAEQPDEPMRISAAIQEVSRLLGPRMTHVRLIVDGDLELRSNGNALVRCILNIFSNSLDAFAEKNVKAPEIYVSCRGTSVRFEDNAGGYQGAVLDDLKKGSFPTTKEHGTGIGTMIISDNVHAMGGQVSFSNGSKGAVLVMDFKGSIFDSFSRVKNFAGR